LCSFIAEGTDNFHPSWRYWNVQNYTNRNVTWFTHKCSTSQLQNRQAQRSGCGQTGPAISAGDKERRSMWPDPAGRRKKNGQMKKNMRCVNIRAFTMQLITALMPTRWNADHWKWQYVAAMPTRAIQLTITWQRDMVVNPVGRHSGRSAFRQSNTQDRNY